MRTRRVLVVTYFFPPLGGGGVQRWLKLARYLPQHSWCPVILTVQESTSTFPQRDASLAADMPAGLAVIRTASPLEKLVGTPRLPHMLRRCLKIPDPCWSWSVRALCRATRLARRGSVDAVITTSWPNSVHLVGYWLRKWYQIPWIADFRDPWTRNPLYQPPNRLRRRLERYWERRVLAWADHITITTYDVDHHFPQGVHASKVSTLLNGYDEADFQGVAGPAANSGLPFRIAYAGDLYDDAVTHHFLQGFETFLRHHASAKDAIELVLAGAAHFDLRGDFTPYTRSLGYVSHAQAIRVMMSSHVLALLTRWGPYNPDYDGQIPAKAYEYLRTGRPILHVAPKPCFMSRLIDRLGAGTTVYTAQETSQQLTDMYRRWRCGVLATRAVDVTALHPFTRRRQAEQLAQILDAMLSRNGSAAPRSRMQSPLPL
jgi:glycosyltransferase involved in cell wall biosynthesis